MNKTTLAGVAVGASILIGGGTINMIPQQSPMVYAYQYPVGTYEPILHVLTATGTYEITNEQPDYKDIDGSGFISVKVAIKKNGETVFSQIQNNEYHQMSKKNGEQYNTPVEYSITPAEAILDGIIK